MTIHVRDAEADRLIRELAEARGVSITEAIRHAAAAALNDVKKNSGLRNEAAVASMLERWDRLPRTPETSTKEFADGLWGDESD
jgi:antitoxin VapB